jgi:hypothetical protein
MLQEKALENVKEEEQQNNADKYPERSAVMKAVKPKIFTIAPNEIKNETC